MGLGLGLGWVSDYFYYDEFQFFASDEFSSDEFSSDGFIPDEFSRTIWGGISIVVSPEAAR